MQNTTFSYNFGGHWYFDSLTDAGGNDGNFIAFEEDDDTQSFDTIYEDSYDYDGPMALAFDIDEDWDDLGEDAGDEFGEGFKKGFEEQDRGLGSFDKQRREQWMKRIDQS